MCLIYFSVIASSSAQINLENEDNHKKSRMRSSSPLSIRNKLLKPNPQNLKSDLSSMDFDNDRIKEIVGYLKSNGLTIFNPMNDDVEIWMNDFELKLKEKNSCSLALKVIQPFLNSISREYFLWIKQKYSSLSLDIELIKALFVKEFAIYKIMKTREANTFSYDSQRLSLYKYVVKKNALLREVYCDLTEREIIVEILAGINDVELIRKFYPLSVSVEDFIEEVKIVECLKKEESNPAELNLSKILEDEYEEDDQANNEDANAEKAKNQKAGVWNSFTAWLHRS